MSVAMAALVFQVYFSQSLREKDCLNQIMQRLKLFYQRNLKLTRFESLKKSMNKVLLYLSNVENQQSMATSGKCTLEYPVEVVESIVQKFMFGDEHKKEYSSEVTNVNAKLQDI
jgi:hypothetical protein